MLKQIAFSLALAFSIPAQAELAAYKLASGEQLKLDGKLDEAFWQKAQVLDQFYEHTPQDKRPAKQPTAMRIAYDERYFYVALQATDPEPQLIRDPFAKRDKVLGDQDFFVFYLDASGENKSAQFFRVNARGSVGDGMFTDGNEDFSPDFDFEASAARTESGYSVELRIPFSSLNYNGGTKPWRVMALRSMVRGDRYRLTSGPAPWNGNCFLCFSTELTGLSAPQQGLNWTATPQLLLHRNRNQDRLGRVKKTSDVDVALDMKVRPRSDWVVDLTLNPDFSQIELDSPALAGNNRFAVFYPEKRPFFLEGADLLEMPLRAVHSRSITDPAWGARATWRGEGADATVLTARDDGGGLVLLPGAYGNDAADQKFKSQATIARGSLHLGSVHLAGLLTDRTLDHGLGYNRLAGGDLTYRINDESRLRGQLLVSSTTAYKGENAWFKGEARKDHALFLDGAYDDERWHLYGQFKDIGDDFRADNGFISQNGIRSVYGELERHMSFQGSWRQIHPALNFERVEDRKGQLVFQSVRPSIGLNGPLDSYFNLQWRENERTRRGEQLGVLSRDYFRFYGEGSPAKWLNRLGLTWEQGDQLDPEYERVGKGGYLNLFTRMRLGDRLEMEQSLDRFWVDGDQQAQGRKYTETAWQWSSIYHLTARDSARLIWQHSKAQRLQTNKRDVVSLVYSHQRGLGTALYAGYTQSDRRDAQGRDKQRELFVKASWAI